MYSWITHSVTEDLRDEVKVGWISDKTGDVNMGSDVVILSNDALPSLPES